LFFFKSFCGEKSVDNEMNVEGVCEKKNVKCVSYGVEIKAKGALCGNIIHANKGER
jgi:hypothetical protein